MSCWQSVADLASMAASAHELRAGDYCTYVHICGTDSGKLLYNSSDDQKVYLKARCEELLEAVVACPAVNNGLASSTRRCHRWGRAFMEGASDDAKPADWIMAAPQNASHRTHDNGKKGSGMTKVYLEARCDAALPAFVLSPSTGTKLCACGQPRCCSSCAASSDLNVTCEQNKRSTK